MHIAPASSVSTVSGTIATPALYTTGRFNDWAVPQSWDFPGLCVKRPLAKEWNAFLPEIEAAFAERDSLQETVVLRGAEEDRIEQVQQAVRKLVASVALPSDLTEQISTDACHIAKAIRSLCPSTGEIHVKLETFGENTCSRWHRDNMVCRAIVCYTGTIGTQFTPTVNVNMDELRSCSNQDHIIRDQSKIASLGLGDVILIKGTGWPHAVRELVHRSPPLSYLPDGRVMTRLLLKLDVPNGALTLTDSKPRSPGSPIDIM